jgi:5-methyltetrahydrofolate--homocysteine methyltransferase
MSRFLDVLNSGRVLLMDGAMGTQLQRAGIGTGECFEHWNLTHPERVRDIHQAYADSGAECLLTNTFQANRPALAKHGLDRQLFKINHAALELARSVAGPERFVLGDIGPIPGGTHGEYDHEAVSWVRDSLGTADALLVETCSDPRALFVVVDCKKGQALGELPVLLSLSFLRNSAGELSTQSGHPPEWFAREARKHGVDALGVNCGREIGIEEIIEIIKRYRAETDLPLFARPNAGTPARMGNDWVYPLTPEKMAARLPDLLEAGITMIGGCCGTTPEHIAALRPTIDDWNARHSPPGTRK